MKKYEYTTYTMDELLPNRFDDHRDRFPLAQKFNQLGELGWILVVTDLEYFIFYREVETK